MEQNPFLDSIPYVYHLTFYSRLNDYENNGPARALLIKFFY